MKDEDKLEQAVHAYVDGWDLDDLIQYAVESTYDYYNNKADKVELEEFIDAYYQGDDEDESKTSN